jgi:hypothetical protein
MSSGHIRDMGGAAQNILELDPLSIIARHELLTRMCVDHKSESTKKTGQRNSPLSEYYGGGGRKNSL